MFDSYPLMEQGYKNQIGDFHALISTGPSGQEYTHGPQASETGMSLLFYIAKITADRLEQALQRRVGPQWNCQLPGMTTSRPLAPLVSVLLGLVAHTASPGPAPSIVSFWQLSVDIV